MERSGQDSWLCKFMYFKMKPVSVLLGDLYEVRKNAWCGHHVRLSVHDLLSVFKRGVEVSWN